MTSPRSHAVLLAVASLVGLVAVIAAFRQAAPAPALVPAPIDSRPAPGESPRADLRATYRPTVLPDRVILTFADDPATSQAVTWRTDSTVRGPVAEVAVATDGPAFEKGWHGYDEKRVKKLAARTEKLSAGGYESLYHSVNFTDLAPKTKYVYRVGDGANWSEWFQFETAAKEPEPFGFIYFG